MIAVILSFILLAYFFWGRSLHKTDLKRHIRVMSLVMIGDLALVGALVVMREALSKVETGMKLSLMIHVPIAISTVVLYVFIAIAAIGTYRGMPWKRWIGRVDKVLVPARVLTSLTSLLVHFF